MLRFAAVSGFFVAINLVFAAVVWLGGTLANRLMPDAAERVWPYMIVGAVALAAAILGAQWGLTLWRRLLARSGGV